METNSSFTPSIRQTIKKFPTTFEKKKDKDYTSRNENDLANKTLHDTDVTETAVSLNEVRSETAEQILKLKGTVPECTSKRRSDMGNTLPDVTCVRKNHNLISVYCA